MEVVFATKELERCYRTHLCGTKAWGETVARKFIQRIGILQAAASISEILALPGLDGHALKGKRRGQYSVTLHDRWRLIFSLAGEQATIILVKEVSKHYGD